MSQDASVQTALVCSQCGCEFTQSDLVHIAGNWVCAECKPAFLNRVMASGVAGASPLASRYGGFWIRFGARMIDGLIFVVPMIIMFILFMPSFMQAAKNQGLDGANPMVFGAIGLTLFVVMFIGGCCYEVLMLKYKSATVGKIACGLKVIRADGRDLSWGVCFGRWFMWNVVTSGIPYLNSIIMLVSSIMVGVDNEKRALHDRACDTRVIYK